jgi:tetratricopeptide (TPR) repeat protein
VSPDLAQILRKTFDWSYGLLTGPQKRLLRRLSVFAAGWCPEEAVPPVCGGEAGDEAPDPASLLKLQHDLMRRSLVVRDLLRNRLGNPGDKSRYRLLETIRGFARARLEAAGELPAAGQRHAEYYLGVALRLEPVCRGRGQVRALDELERELENFRAAQKWFADPAGQAALIDDPGAFPAPQPQRLLELTWALSHLYYIRGLFSEGRQWLAQGFAAAQATGGAGGQQPPLPPHLWANALTLMGILAYHQADYPQAQTLLERARELADQARYRVGVGCALSGLGFIAYRWGKAADYRDAIDLYRASLAEFEAAEPSMPHRDWYVAWAQCDLAFVLHLQGSQQEASDLLGKSRETRVRIQDKWGQALALHYLGRVRWAQMRYDEAQGLQEQSLSVAREIRYQRGIALAAHHRANALVKLRRKRPAGQLYAESLRLRREQGDWSGVAASLVAVAAWACRTQPAKAARLLGAADAIRERNQEEPEPLDREQRDDTEAVVLRKLGDDRYRRECQAGRELPREQAVEDAIDLANPSDESPQLSLPEGVSAPVGAWAGVGL